VLQAYKPRAEKLYSQVLKPGKLDEVAEKSPQQQI
jgi:hypothetical protein